MSKTPKDELLDIIDANEELFQKAMWFGANHLLTDMVRANLIKPMLNGKIPNKASVHPEIVRLFKEAIKNETHGIIILGRKIL